MAKPVKRARQSRRTARLDFAAIEIVGSLLTPDIVTRVAVFDMPGQSEEGYAIPRGLTLRDEIARYYRIAHAHWERFVAARDGNASASQVFLLDLLKECFGFDDIRQSGAIVLSGRQFPIRHASHSGKVPVVLSPLAPAESRKSGIDETLPQFGEEARRRSATQLLQDYLNAATHALWGVVSDGRTLRLMRDNASLTRPAWIEADLEQIFSEDLFADFSVLWLLLHASRFGTGDTTPSDCSLERWREQGLSDGSAAKEKLRLGVEATLLELGRGFLEDPANTALRDALQTGALTRHGYFEMLLRLVYRLIFLFAAEDRNLLHSPGASNTARAAYRNGYSVGRLRERCTRSAALDQHHDVWDGLRAVFNALTDGASKLGLTALGGLFSTNIAALTDARITNRRILKAIWHLSWFRPDGQPMTRVNWRDMQTEELGSVYESLLELIPLVHLETCDFTFTYGDAANKGNERKTTGTYYTPDSLVQLLLATTLDPLLDAAEVRNPTDPAAEILKLSFIDPACGSGHFLLGAARRAATRIARRRSSGAPGQDVFQRALREVVSHCIFGVDRNPMAVELCKVALWIEVLEPGKPLSFLDARIRCGDSLVGVFDYNMLRDGLPNEAFDALTGDTKAVARAWRDINKKQRDGKTASGLFETLRAPASIVDGAAEVLAMPEDTIQQTNAKARAWDRLLRDPKRLALKKACDMYVAAFLLPKSGDDPDPDAGELDLPTTEDIWQMVRATDGGPALPSEWTALVGRNRVFHWPLEFPAVMASGGFDAVIGNPPWEVSQLSEAEFFASRDPEIATLQGNERKKAIKRLKDDNPRLWQEFNLASRAVEATNTFFRSSGRFPLTAAGKINTYPLFAEHFSRLARTPGSAGLTQTIDRAVTDVGGECQLPSGRAGVIVPTGIATDSSTSAFFGNLVVRKRLAALYGFYEVRKWFKDTDDKNPFCIFVVASHKDPIPIVSNIQKIDEVYEKERQVLLGADDFKFFNPNTLTTPLFRARADRDLTQKLYRAAPVLIRERPDNLDGDENPWGVTFQQGLYNMTSASEFFRTAEQLDGQGFKRDGVDWRYEDGRCYVPLFEAKMIHHFDHRFGSYAGLNARPADGVLPETSEATKASPDYEPEPWYWVPEDETSLRVARVPSRLKQYYRKEDAEGCLKVLAEWMLGTLDPEDLDPASLARALPRAKARLRDVLGMRVLERNIVGGRITTWLGKAVPRACKMQRETPLSEDDLAFIKDAPSDPLELTGLLIDRKQPRWLMGWRDFCRSKEERTVIAAVFPKVGAGDTLLLKHQQQPARIAAALNACLCSITLDYICRQKIGGVHLKYNVFKQNAVLAPNQFSREDFTFLSPRVLELTYTSHSMRPWAEDLGHPGAPFAFDADRRAFLRAELDAFFARKYGLTRDELRYILDPADTHGSEYPSETFRVLKRDEIERFGEYRTQRLVLEAFDRLTGA